MTERRLAAILVADVVGYSKLVGSDEAGTLFQLSDLRKQIIEPVIAAHAGRLFKSVGDGFLVEFSSAVQAVTAAQAIQQANATGPLSLRIGIHIGDVVVQGDDLMGDGVNIAARIEGVAGVGGIAISRAVHEQVRDRLDAAFADKGEIQLKNIIRPVQVFTIGGVAPVQAVSLALPDKPSIAVLPFQNMSGDPEQEYFADGVVEDIITALSRFKSLFVISRSSSFTYKGKAIDIKQVGRELGVRYVLEGSVRKAANRVRVTAQLVDAVSGVHVWAERYDRRLDDIFTVQEEITVAIVTSIAPQIDQAEQSKALNGSVDSSLYDRALRARHLAFEGHRKADGSLLVLAIQEAEEVLRAAPSNVVALTALAYANGISAFLRMAPDRDAALATVIRVATRIIELDGANALGYALRAFGWLWGAQYERYEDALDDARRAHELNPNDTFVLLVLANGEAGMGHATESIQHAQEILRLSPRHPRAFDVYNLLSFAHLAAGQYAEGLDWAAKALKDVPTMASSRVQMTAHLAGLGRLEEARASLEVARTLSPAMVQAAMGGKSVFYRPEDRQRFQSLLKLAAGPDAEQMSATLALPDKPSIAVLPFQNMSGDPQQEYFADGMTEDILTGLSRFQNLFVIARNSSFTYKGKAVDVKTVGVELGVAYLLEGSVRAAAGRIRITAQLIDAKTAHHVWAERYDRAVADIFDVQDEVTAQIVATIDFEVRGAEAQRPHGRATAGLAAWSQYHKAFPLLFRLTREENERATAAFAALREGFPRFAAGHAGFGFSRTSEVIYGWAPDRKGVALAAVPACQHAVELDDKDAFCHLALGRALLVAGERELGLSSIERAVARNPNSALAHLFRGMALIGLDRHAEALDAVDLALRLSPRDPGLWSFYLWRATCRAALGDFKAAIGAARQSVAERPDLWLTHMSLAVTLVRGGHTEEAMAAFGKAHGLNPTLTRKEYMAVNALFVSPARLRELDAAAVRLGLPD